MPPVRNSDWAGAGSSVRWVSIAAPRYMETMAKARSAHGTSGPRLEPAMTRATASSVKLIHGRIRAAISGPSSGMAEAPAIISASTWMCPPSRSSR